MREKHRRQVTFGKGSRTTSKVCRLRTSGQQVPSPNLSPRKGRSLPPARRRPARAASPPLRPASSSRRPRACGKTSQALAPRGLSTRRPSDSRRRGRPGRCLLPGPVARARSPAPVCGSGAARAPPAARSSSSAGGPSISPPPRPQDKFSDRLVRLSVRPLPQRHPRRLLPSTRRFSQTAARILVRTRCSGHRNTILPARRLPAPPAPPPPLLNSSNGSNPAEPRAGEDELPPP
nr:serine/arginine repetitive matrix protein 1-like [Manis javanica]